MQSVAIEKDMKEAAKRARAQQQDDERKARIFNPKGRLMGVSVLFNHSIQFIDS
jgi:hypothetical protein